MELPVEDNKAIGFNYFKIVSVKELEQGYCRVTVENQYVRTNNSDLVLYCTKLPIEGERIELKINRV